MSGLYFELATISKKHSLNFRGFTGWLAGFEYFRISETVIFPLQHEDVLRTIYNTFTSQNFPCLLELNTYQFASYNQNVVSGSYYPRNR